MREVKLLEEKEGMMEKIKRKDKERKEMKEKLAMLEVGTYFQIYLFGNNYQNCLTCDLKIIFLK